MQNSLARAVVAHLIVAAAIVGHLRVSDTSWFVLLRFREAVNVDVAVEVLAEEEIEVKECFEAQDI